MLDRSEEMQRVRRLRRVGLRGAWLFVAVAFAVTFPALYFRFTGVHLPPVPCAIVFGVGIVGAAFILSWASEVAEMDISQALALAFLALVAVLPEYAVDLYFAWAAGKDISYAPYAVANMTGANRLLIGIGWSAVALIYAVRNRAPALVLEEDHRTEILFLVVLGIFAFTMPLVRNIALWHSVVFVSLFVLYLLVASQVEAEEPKLMGPALAIGLLPTARRRAVVIFMFIFAAVLILSSAEPFAEGLVSTGRELHIDEFLLVQWLAPLASEAPELLVAVLFSLRDRAGAAMRVLISSKVNQWSLLIGTLAIVFSISSGAPGALPLDERQVEEVLLTAAQTAFATAMLCNLRMSHVNAALLFILFFTQLMLPDPMIRYIFSGVYIVLALAMLAGHRSRREGFIGLVPAVFGMVRGARAKGVKEHT